MSKTNELNSFNFKVPSAPENIILVESFIENIRTEIEIADEIYGNIMVALTEAVNNSITHGNKLDMKKMVELFMEKEDNVLVFTITDEGTGFNYDSLPDPTAPENLEKPTGRGVFLMRQLSDNIQFLDNGKMVKMHFKLA